MSTVRTSTIGATLLIVEDDILPAMVLADELRDAGFHVLELTERVEAAMAAARACKPDLALVNIELHGRDDGIELAHQFKLMDIPVLFISGQEEKARSAKAVAIGSLAKPYHPEQMIGAVRYLLRHIAGDESLPRPTRLEVFDDPPNGNGVLPEAA
jgi:DNA-binding response OmpR family regulator